MTDKRSSFIDKCIRDKNGKVALAQRPNLPLLLWLIAEAIGIVAKHGELHKVVRDVATGALLLWSVLEIVQGVNYARRALGVVVFIMLVTATFIR